LDLAVIIDAGIDRDQEVLALRLRRVSCEIDIRDRLRTSRDHLVEELSHDQADIGQTDIARFDDVIASCAHRLGDDRGVACYRRERPRVLIGAVADHQRDA